jgi:hypothetical protein
MTRNLSLLRPSTRGDWGHRIAAANVGGPGAEPGRGLPRLLRLGACPRPIQASGRLTVAIAGQESGCQHDCRGLLQSSHRRDWYWRTRGRGFSLPQRTGWPWPLAINLHIGREEAVHWHDALAQPIRIPERRRNSQLVSHLALMGLR